MSLSVFLCPSIYQYTLDKLGNVSQLHWNKIRGDLIFVHQPWTWSYENGQSYIRAI